METTSFDHGVGIERASWVRWGPCLAGAVTAIAVTAMVMSLWLALGYGSNMDFFTRNLQWFFLGTALGALFVGGVVAGWAAGLRGAAVGALDGMVVWAVVLVAALIPLTLRAVDVANRAAPRFRLTAFGFARNDTWPLFITAVAGLACAVIGGAIGGAIGRPRRLDATPGYVPQRAAYDDGYDQPVVDREPVATRTGRRTE